MSVDRLFRWSSKLFVVVTLAGFSGLAAHAGEPVDIPSSSWTTEGDLKTKVDGDKQTVLVEVTLVFGPDEGLAADQFVLTVDDGEFPISIVGTYDNSKPGKPSFDVLDDELLDALELDLEQQGIEIDLKSKLKAKAKMKDGVDVMKIKFKMAAKVSVDFEGVKDSAKVKYGYKGKGSRDE